jgi:hypothetical protein
MISGQWTQWTVDSGHTQHVGHARLGILVVRPYGQARPVIGRGVGMRLAAARGHAVPLPQSLIRLVRPPGQPVWGHSHWLMRRMPIDFGTVLFAISSHMLIQEQTGWNARETGLC